MGRTEDDPGLPLKLWRCSNGEFLPPPLNPVAREAMRRARILSEESARRLGWSRRRFLTSSTGIAAGLIALGACSDEKRRAQPSTTTRAATPTTAATTVVTTTASTAAATSSTALGPGGILDVPPTAATDPDLATSTTHLPPGTLLIDVQNHLLDYELHPDAADFGAGFPQASCDAGDSRLCFTPQRWADLVFGQSDTTMAVLSAIPVVGGVSPLSIEAMEHGKQVAAELCGDGRVLIQGHAVPNVGPIEPALDSMSASPRSTTSAHGRCTRTRAPVGSSTTTIPTAPSSASSSWPTSKRSGRRSSQCTRGCRGIPRSLHLSTSALPRRTIPASRSSSTTRDTRAPLPRVRTPPVARASTGS
jgi:uncharacterized protein